MNSITGRAPFALRLVLALQDAQQASQLSFVRQRDRRGDIVMAVAAEAMPMLEPNATENLRRLPCTLLQALPNSKPRRPLRTLLQTLPE